MHPRKAMEALGPAMARWKRLLLDNFSVGRLLKLSFVALLAEASGGFNGNFNAPSNKVWHKLNVPHAVVAAMVAFLLVAVVVGMVIGMVIFYLACRMKFVEFHIAASGDTRVGPAWQRYGRQTWRLFWTTLIVDVIAFLALLAVAVPFVLLFAHRMHGAGSPSPAQLLGIILLAVPLFLAWVCVLQFVLMVVRDLMLPVWALEDGSVGYSWEVARSIIERDIQGFLGYTLVKIVMTLAASVASVMAFLAALLVSAIPFAAVGFAIYLPLHHGGVPGKVLMIALFCVEGLVGLAWVLVMLCACFGAPMLLFQCYAVEWVAGRYPPLGNWMYPPPPTAPVVPTPPETPPPPAGGDDWVTVLG